MLRRNLMSSPKKKKGQSTVEYIILVAAVIAAVLILVSTGAFNKGYESAVNGVSGAMNTMGTRLSNSY